MTKLWFVIAVLIPVVATQNELPFDLRTLRIICSRGLPLVSRELEMICCQVQSEVFRMSWYNGGWYLSTHLEYLHTWRCPQLQTECEARHYAFNEFTTMVYDRMCNQSKLVEKCASTLEDIAGTGSTSRRNQLISRLLGNSSSLPPNLSNVTFAALNYTDDWIALVEKINVTSLKTEDLVKPCVQVAQMDAAGGGFGNYTEIIATHFPFCSMAWFGFSNQAVEREGGFRTYDYLETACKANFFIMFITVLLLAVAIITANSLVIVVFSTTPQLQNTQAIFKVNLAVADLLVGAFVLPTFAANLWKIFMRPAKFGSMYTLKMANFSNQFVDWEQVPMPGRDGFTVRKSSGFFFELFDYNYTFAAGCVTSIFLTVSIYTLAFAGLDRFLVVYFPLKYRKYNAKKIAIRVSIVIWAVAVILSLLPLMADLRYGIVSSTMFIMYGPEAHIVYIVMLLVPLIMVWVPNILVFVVVRKQARKRRQLATHSTNKAQENESEGRLATTLGIIVGVFTLSAIPIIVTSVIPAVLHDKFDASNLAEFSAFGDSVMHSTDFIAAMILMSNSFWNCFIYSARNKDFKRGLRDLGQKIKRSLRLTKERITGIQHISSRSTSSATKSGPRSSLGLIQTGTTFVPSKS